MFRMVRVSGDTILGEDYKAPKNCITKKRNPTM